MAVVLGVDLGSQNIEICQKGKGIILREPNVAAVDARGNVLAVGTEALLIDSRAPGTVTLRRPYVNGAVTDFNLTAEVLDRFLENAAPKVKKNIIASVKYGLDEESRHTLLRAFGDCRTGKVVLVDTVMAAYKGIGAPMSDDPFGGTLLCDIGAEAVEAAYIRGTEILRQTSSPVGGNAQNEALTNYVKSKYGVLITEESAHGIKCAISLTDTAPESYEMTGIDTATGMPRRICASGAELKKLYITLTEPVARLIAHMLHNLPRHGENESHADSVILIGGGAKLPGVDKYISACIGRTVNAADAPLDAVVQGLELMCDEMK